MKNYIGCAADLALLAFGFFMVIFIGRAMWSLAGAVGRLFS